ncbi:MAG: MFS transporter, partial [Mucilaginibacter polytrichastri]|nr:MFS transporter [Mucilaginibacter polytrichastri]
SAVLLFGLKNAEIAKPESDEIAEAEVPANIFASFKMLLSLASFRILLFYFCALGIVNWLVYGWLPTFLKEHFHLGLGEAGFSATAYVQIGSFIGVVCGGLLADRWATFNARGRLYTVIIGFSIGAPFLFLMASTPVFTIGIMAMVIYGLSRGFNDANLMPILCQLVNNRYIATGYGFLNFLSTIIGGVMVYVGGMLKDANISLSIIYQVSAVLMLLATWSLFAVRIKNTTAARS